MLEHFRINLIGCGEKLFVFFFFFGKKFFLKKQIVGKFGRFVL